MGATAKTGRRRSNRGSPTGRRPGRLGRGAVAGAVAVMVMIIAALLIGRSSLQSAEQARLNERVRLIPRLAQYTTSIYNPVLLQGPADRTPFPEHDVATDARILSQYRTGPTGDSTALAALVRLDGSVVVSNPPGAIPPTTELGSAWQAALSGRAAQSRALRYQGQPGWATLAPIGAGRQWGVLIVVQNSIGTSAQTFTERLGTITGNDADGGFASVDAGGRALIAWDRRRLGQQLINPARIRTLPLDQTVTATSDEAGHEVTWVLFRGVDGTTLLFRQNTAALYADLRSKQRERDFVLLIVLAASVAALTIASLLRFRLVHRSQARLQTLLSNTKDLIAVVRPDSRLILVSPAVGTLLGCPVQEWLGSRLLDHVHPEDVDDLARLIEAPAAGRPLLDIRLRDHTGDYRWFDVEAGDVSDVPELRGILLTCHSAQERKALKDQLTQQARLDALTGLANRATLTRKLADSLVAGSDLPSVGLLFIDLDRFKQINDEFGHATGDQVLCTVADRLRHLVREHDLVSRFGGDEFGVVLQHTSAAEAQQVADRIVADLSEPIRITVPAWHAGAARTGDLATRSTEPFQVTIGASVGIAIAGGDLNRPAALLRAADGAMYRAKEGGRCRAVLWHGPADQPATIPTIVTAPAVPAPSIPAAADSRPADGVPLPAPREDVDLLAPARSADDDGLNGHPRTGSPTFAAPGTGAGPSPWRHRVRSLGVLGSAVLTLLLVAGLSSWQSGQAQRSAERQRMGERLALTERVAAYATMRADLQRLIQPVSAAPWSLDGSVADAVVIQDVLTSELGGDSALATLRRRSGSLLVASSLRIQPDVNTHTPTWHAVLRGVVGYWPVERINGQLYTTYAIPILRHGRVTAVLLVSQTLQNSLSQQDLETVGSLGFGDGGLTSVDMFGRATYSWNRALLGTQTVPAAEIDRLPLGRAFTIRGPPGYVTLAAAVPTPVAAHRKVIIFQQPASVFYGDLRSGDDRRQLALFLIVAMAIGLLTWERWQQFQVVRGNEQRLTALLRNAHDIVVVLADGNTAFISSAVVGLLGHEPERWLHQPLDGLLHPQDRPRLARYIAEEIGAETETAATLHDIRLLSADGRYRWFDLHASDLRDHPEVAGIVFTCHEVGEQKALQDELSYRSRHDSLTGLPNRAAFRQHLDQISVTGGPEAGFTVFFVDLDRFKPVNDAFGHDAGDDVLRSVARRLTESMTSCPGSLVCRLGGDEFVVLATGIDELIATRLADAMLARLRQPIRLRAGRGQAVEIGATIGIASALPGETPLGVVRRADEAMYQGKAAGRGRYAVSIA